MNRSSTWFRLFGRTLFGIFLLCGLISFPWHSRANAEDPAPGESPPATPRSDPLEDPPAPLDPSKNRTEMEEDRVQAAALFAHGRLLFQRGDLTGALRRYERAYRYDPEAAPSLLAEIVQLGFELKREEEATRYAVRLVEQQPRDAALVSRLAEQLTSEGQFQRAIDLYEKALTLRKGEPADPALVLMHLQLARLYAHEDQMGKAAQSLDTVRRALETPDRFGLDDAARKRLAGKDGAIFSLMGETYLSAGRADEALEMFTEANKIKANPGMLALGTARVEQKRGHAEKSLAELDKFFEAKLEVQSTEPYELLQQLLTDTLKDADKARTELIVRLAKQHADDPANAALGYFLGDLYCEAGKLDEAEKTYRDLLLAEPSLEGYQGLISIYRRKPDVAKLLDTLGEAVVLTGTLEPLGKEAEEVTKDEKLRGQLIDEAQRRRKEKPDSLVAGSATAAGLLAIAAERYDVAGELFQFAVDADKERRAELLLTWGRELLLAEQSERAAEVFQQAVDQKVLPDDNPVFYFYLAGARELAGQTDKALEAARTAAKARENPTFKSREAWIYYHAKRNDEAEKAYRKLISELDAASSSSSVREAAREARIVLSNICNRQGRFDDAVELLEQVLDEYPEDTGALNDLGYLWTEAGQHLERALDMVSQAVAEEPDNIAYRDSLGWALYRLGKYEQAQVELEKAVAGDSPDGEILDHLGEVRLALKNKAGAIEAWERAAEGFEKADDAERAKIVRAKIKKNQEQ